jgi:hypothetical protein
MIADAAVNVDPNSTSKKSSWPSVPGFALDSSGKVDKLEPKLSRKLCGTRTDPYSLLAGFPDPQRNYGGRELDVPFSCMIKTMRDSDPAPRPQLALLVSCITTAAAAHFQNVATSKQQAVADLITVAFFFLLQVGEYTMPTGNRGTRRVQFRCQDICLWRFGQLLDHTAPVEHLLQADGVTLHIDNKKNGQRGQTVHHFTVNA